MIRRLIDARLATKELAAAEESAAVNLRLYAQECAKTRAAEKLAADLSWESQDRFREVQKLRSERDALTDALDRSRDISAGLAADLAEVRRDLLRALPVAGDPTTAPRPDLAEAARLRSELARLRQFCAAQENRLAVAEGRDIQGTVVGHG